MNVGVFLSGNDGVYLLNWMIHSDRPHNSRGGWLYPKETYGKVIGLWQLDWLSAIDMSYYKAICAYHNFPHMDMRKRWICLFQNVGHVLPKRDTGNHHAQWEVHGVNIVIKLAIFFLVRLKAYINKVWAYANNQNPAEQPYFWFQIVCAEQRLGLWKKAGSLTANMAYRPIRLSNCKDYWKEPYLIGVNNQATSTMIKAGFKLDLQARKDGKVTKQKRADAT